MYPVFDPPTVELRLPRPRDPLAVAVGNASLLGVGYLLLGRRVPAALAAVGSITLVVVLGTTERVGWLQYVLFAWWVAGIAHGFLVARRRAGRPEHVRRHRIVAAAVAVPVVATFVIVRVDVNGMADDADAAHRAGECDSVLATAAGVGFWQRVGDGPVADALIDGAAACRLVVRARDEARGDREAAAATIARYEDLPDARWDGAHQYRADLLLDQAAEDLGDGLVRQLTALDNGFGLLATVRDEFPDRRDDVTRVLDDFLGQLPDNDACDTTEIVDWMHQQRERTAELDRAAEIIGQVAPTALVGCADYLMAHDNHTGARARYEQLAKQYPKSQLAPRAKAGVTRATHAIQLDTLRERLRTTYTDEQPAYCRNPSPYGAAKPYRGPGPHRALVYGQDFQRDSLPRGWRAKDAANATLIICAGEGDYGDSVQTCPYTGGLAPNGVTYVTFHKRRIPVRVYEVRTGRVVRGGSVQIGGTSCPAVIHYTTYGVDIGPPSTDYVESSTSDIRDAYRPVIDP
ncbi:tetratricopeptide repeat protein [Actinophytocola gossypii]|uniref:Uncharacterized protein n=1 Tax=Actinophytocola gossypii TaxID=2812003 RepID=A0ABT2JD46_9PSEU|nr:hypothetical protein [Actinophytocola gossypii]MCT2585797.1 hypothetical protein [Actinophytocola gossypii]